MSEDNGQHPAQEVQTLFLVVIDLDGGSRVVINPQELFHPQRAATAKDIFPALSNILADFEAMKQAEAVVALQTTLARQMAVKLEHEELRRSVEEGYGDTGP